MPRFRLVQTLAGLVSIPDSINSPPSCRQHLHPSQESIAFARTVDFMGRSGIRSRTGCFTCRQRKKKCNEEKPVCSGCRRNCLQCHWPSAAETDRAGVKKSNRPRAGSSWRSLQSSRDADAESGSSGREQHHTDQATCDRAQDEAVTISVSRSDSDSSSRRDEALPKSPVGALPTFITLGLNSPHFSSQAGLSATTAQGWEENEGEAFEIVDGESIFIEPNHDARGSFSSHSASSFGHHSSSSPPKRLGDLIGSSHPLPGPSHDSQGSSGIPSEGMMATGDETMGESMMADRSHGSVDLTAHDVFGPLEEADMHPDAPEPTAHNQVAISIPNSMSLLPQQDPDAFHLLSYYLSRTANSMGNGSTDSNPFVSTLIPLAFSDPLVLQLLLAQSAVHRQVGETRDTGDQIAHRYYTGSLRSFRSAIREYISGKSTNRLILTTGSLILSLTEVARGDIDGNIFDHIIAAKSLLVELSVDSGRQVPQDFMDFLIEYYTHMSVLSMISVDPQHCTNPLLDTTIEKLARRLIEKKYIGQLTGCWLELLLAIPHIFDLGQRMRGLERPSPDDMMMFSLLQSQITAFDPPAGTKEETCLAGLVFQKAVLLYLWSILGCPQEGQTDGLHTNLMRTAVTEGITLLQRIPATSRVNTSLCWPLTIIGCCTTDQPLQAILRTRLQSMFSCIGLGNMGETLLLLELVWASPSERRSPWVLCEVMQEHQRWISFA